MPSRSPATFQGHRNRDGPVLAPAGWSASPSCPSGFGPGPGASASGSGSIACHPLRPPTPHRKGSDHDRLHLHSCPPPHHGAARPPQRGSSSGVTVQRVPVRVTFPDERVSAAARGPRPSSSSSVPVRSRPARPRCQGRLRSAYMAATGGPDQYDLADLLTPLAARLATLVPALQELRPSRTARPRPRHHP